MQWIEHRRRLPPERNARGSVSRVLSTRPKRSRRGMGDHSSRTGLAPGLQQSTRTTGRSSPYAVPIRSCSRWGLPCRSRCRGRGALLPHPFDLTRSEKPAGRSAFCGTVPGVAPAGHYPAPSLLGARTFLPASLRGDRPTLWQTPLRMISIRAQAARHLPDGAEDAAGSLGSRRRRCHRSPPGGTGAGRRRPPPGRR